MLRDIWTLILKEICITRHEAKKGGGQARLSEAIIIATALGGRFLFFFLEEDVRTQKRSHYNASAHVKERQESPQLKGSRQV